MAIIFEACDVWQTKTKLRKWVHVDFTKMDSLKGKPVGAATKCVAKQGIILWFYEIPQL